MSNPWDDLGDADNGGKESVGKKKSSTSAKRKAVVDDNSFSNKAKQNFNFGGFFSFFSNDKNDLNQNNAKEDNNFNKRGDVNSIFGLPLPRSNFSLFLSVTVAILFFWCLSGFYTVEQEERAVVMRFGKYVRDENSGLHYHLPYPIENVVKEATTRVRVIRIGGDDNANGNAKLGEGWALTGDENIVNLELNVQWKIDDLKKFVFNVRDKQQTIYDATQSAVREVISKRKLASILTSERGDIEKETKQLLQQMLDSYNIGVNVLVVQMLKIDPPLQVIDSFRDVQTARVDKESEINSAYKYKNDILPKVRGEAGKIIEDANGYAIAVVNKANGDASRFNQVYEQYKNAPFITRKRMYLDTMEDLLLNNKITIIDENVKNVFINNNRNIDKRKVAISNIDSQISKDNQALDE